MSKITFSETAWEEYLSWQMEDKKSLKKINALLQDIQREPFGGLGKPEPLKGSLFEISITDIHSEEAKQSRSAVVHKVALTA